jgi:hypothetical protein
MGGDQRMTKIAIVPNAAGTGTFTIEAPNSNSNRTLTLPDEAGTVMTDATTLLTSQLPAQLSVSSSAAAGSLAVDASGRVTMPSQPAFRATSDNTSQSLTNLVPAVVIFKVAETNIGNVYNTSNGRFTAPVSGVYTLSASLLISQGGSQRVDLHFNKNGGDWLNHEFRDGGAVFTNASFNISMQGYLTANDFIEVVTVLHGANGAVYLEPKFWNFSGALLG